MELPRYSGRSQGLAKKSSPYRAVLALKRAATPPVKVRKAHGFPSYRLRPPESYAVPPNSPALYRLKVAGVLAEAQEGSGKSFDDR